MNPSDEQDSLWKLLGKVRLPAASPFFARNVIREIRGLRQDPVGFFQTLRRHWQLTAAAATAFCVIAAAAFQFTGDDSQIRQIDSLMAMTEQVSASPDFYVINDLDDLLASEDSSVWLDQSMH